MNMSATRGRLLKLGEQCQSYVDEGKVLLLVQGDHSANIEVVVVLAE